MDLTQFLPFLNDYAAPVAIVIVTVLMVLTGKLVPKATVESIEADREAWKEAFWKMHDTSKVQGQAVTALTEQGETTAKLIKDLPLPEQLKEGDDEKTV